MQPAAEKLNNSCNTNGSITPLTPDLLEVMLEALEPGLGSWWTMVGCAMVRSKQPLERDHQENQQLTCVEWITKAVSAVLSKRLGGAYL